MTALQGHVVVLGASGAGKSALTHALIGALTKDNISDEHLSFIGPNYVSVIENVKVDHRIYNIEMRVYDSAEQMNYHNSNLKEAGKADVVIVCVNPELENHFESCEKLIDVLRRQNTTNKTRSIFVVATHADEVDEHSPGLNNLRGLATDKECMFFKTSTTEYVNDKPGGGGIENLRNELGQQLAVFDLHRKSARCCIVM